MALSARPGEEALEEALGRLGRTGPEYAGGLANHGPMAAEALVALGRSEAVGPWVDRYSRSLGPHPEARSPITASEWKESLGRFDRMGDWTVFFEREIAESGWRVALDLWALRLAPGLAAAATHGLIRTGHAARALGAMDSAARRHELAEGLAYWAARYQKLPEVTASPGAAAPGSKGSLPSEAIASVQLLPEERRGRRRLISDGLIALEGFAPFAGVADMADASRDPSAFLSDLTRTFAGVYFQQASDTGAVITFIHTVTGPSAIRLLLPHVGDRTRPALLRYGWQAAAAMYAALARPSRRSSAEPVPAGEVGEENHEDLVDRAVATGDEHAIKFTEACLREHALDPSPVFLTAAADACLQLA
jgi:questin oxidase-like protein